MATENVYEMTLESSLYSNVENQNDFKFPSTLQDFDLPFEQFLNLDESNNIATTFQTQTQESSEDENRNPKSKQKQTKRRNTTLNCSICQRQFTNAYNLRVHIMQHNGEFRFECPQCGKKFRQRNKMEMHRVIHSKTKPHECEICGKCYRFRDYLKIHRRLHEGLETQHYKCKYCLTSFHSLHLRRVHIQTEHTNVETSSESYVCPIALCGKKFSANCNLIAHVKRHRNQREHQCVHCQRSFFDSAQLRSHLLTHTNLKPFECDICGARFQRKSNLEQHLKIHSSIKSYVCPICKQSFAQRAGLCIHQKKKHSST